MMCNSFSLRWSMLPNHASTYIGFHKRLVF
nr:MAG TPA: hypothetical protein [Crassvirales sp.]DAU07223.1 MAG TPA: hypothetical protein [Caudoviricetes sp.]